MPTEQLFGGYHFQAKVSAKDSADSFDFKASTEKKAHIGLLLPAVQTVDMAREPMDDFTGVAEAEVMQGHTLVELLEVRGRSRVDDGGGEWTDILTSDDGVSLSDGGADGLFL